MPCSGIVHLDQSQMMKWRAIAHPHPRPPMTCNGIVSLDQSQMIKSTAIADSQQKKGRKEIANTDVTLDFHIRADRCGKIGAVASLFLALMNSLQLHRNVNPIMHITNRSRYPITFSPANHRLDKDKVVTWGSIWPRLVFIWLAIGLFYIWFLIMFRYDR